MHSVSRGNFAVPAPRKSLGVHGSAPVVQRRVPFGAPRWLVLIALLTLSAGCRTAPLENVERAPLSIRRPVPLHEVEQAIQRGGERLGWTIDVLCPGRLRGTLHVRSHEAVVDIVLWGGWYNIRYRESTNLDYEPSSHTIHKNYNQWVDELNKAIQSELPQL